MIAKELVNTFYQPLGYLKHGSTSDELWEYSKARAIEWCDFIINELNQLRKPEYTSFIKSPEEILDGYEKIAFFEELKSQVSEL